MTDQAQQSTTVRADYDPDFFKRFLYLSLGCLFFGSWFLFDAVKTYPKELKRAEAYWVEVGPKRDDGHEEYEPLEEAEWLRIADENGWSTKPPKVKPDEQRQKTGGQYFYAALCLVVSVPCLLKWYLPRGSWIEGTDTELKTSWGTEFAYSDIQQINKKKWQEKGVAKIKYNRNGRTATLVFDDYKYLQEPMSRIMVAMEAGLSDEQIVGAEREEIRLARKKAEAAEKAAAEQAAADHTPPETGADSESDSA